ncbi:MAG: tetratricopeptide repeat protein [Tepidisphaeraceae bacterium]
MRLARLATVIALLVLVTFSARSALADALWISSGGGNPVKYDNVKVLKVDAGKITFRAASGNETSKELADVTRMQLADEPNLNSAEDAYASAKWDAATDGYQKVLKSSGKPWVRDWAAGRLIESANKNGRFDAAVAAYIVLVKKDPEAALRTRPNMPDKGSTFLDTGEAEINKALNDRELETEQKQALLTLLLEIQRTKDDQKGAAATVEKLTALNPGAAASGSDGGTRAGTSDAGGSAANNAALAGVKLSIAMLALDNKEYKKALETIDQNLPIFTDTKNQADALWARAQALNGLATDPETTKDAALAYMRVVANFKDKPGAPHVAASIFKTAELLEKLEDTANAMRLYQDVADRYAQSDVAPKAKAALERLKQPKKES